jgi:hypothetical protein
VLGRAFAAAAKMGLGVVMVTWALLVALSGDPTAP